MPDAFGKIRQLLAMNRRVVAMKLKPVFIRKYKYHDQKSKTEKPKFTALTRIWKHNPKTENVLTKFGEKWIILGISITIFAASIIPTEPED